MNYPSPEVAREAARKECLKHREKEKPTLAPDPAKSRDKGAWVCSGVAGVFCTDKKDFGGWGVVPDSHNPCGALAMGHDYITWSTATNVSHVYRAGMELTKSAAEQDALQNA